MGTAPQRLIRFLCAGAAVMLAAALLNYVVDPLQFFRPAQLLPAMYSNDSRMQDAGLIRSQSFNTVFMGTSLGIHFRQSDIDRVLGVRSVKLAMTGANSREQTFVLDAAMARRPQRVIWQMDDWIFRDAKAVDDDIHIPAELYRRSVRGVVGYLFSGAMARESLWILARSISPLQPVVTKLTNGIMFRFSIADVNEINALRSDFDIAGAYNARAAIASFRRLVDPAHRGTIAEGYNYDAMVRGFERDAVALIAKNPEVTFDIYFPPYSILQFVAMRDASPATLETTYDFAAYAFPRLTEYPNVRLHDFRAVKTITHDLNNYADVIHHSPAVDLKVLEMLAEGRYLIDRSAPTASLELLKIQVEAYRVEGP